jgi:hypothetical protein
VRRFNDAMSAGFAGTVSKFGMLWCSEKGIDLMKDSEKSQQLKWEMLEGF